MLLAAANEHPTHISLLYLKVSADVQKHPWYQKALPKGLQLDTYNLHYVELSRAAASSTDLAAAIKKVMQVCPVSPRPYSRLRDGTASFCRGSQTATVPTVLYAVRLMNVR